MRWRVNALVLLGCLVHGLAHAQAGAPAPILPDSLRWVSNPNLSGVQVAWVLGTATGPGLYAFRVRLAPGSRIPPHTHPDERNTTVLAGTLYVGFGEVFDESKTVAVPAGSIYVAPANVPHYVWAKDGDAMYQESGIGPTGTTIIKRPGP